MFELKIIFISLICQISQFSNITWVIVEQTFYRYTHTYKHHIVPVDLENFGHFAYEQCSIKTSYSLTYTAIPHPRDLYGEMGGRGAIDCLEQWRRTVTAQEPMYPLRVAARIPRARYNGIRSNYNVRSRWRASYTW